MTIEFTYSPIIGGKFVVRTKGVEIKGVGIKQHHSEKETGRYNVYSLTKNAFSKIRASHPEMTIMP